MDFSSGHDAAFSVGVPGIAGQQALLGDGMAQAMRTIHQRSHCTPHAFFLRQGARLLEDGSQKLA